LLALGAMATLGVGEVMSGFRLGFTTFLGSKAAGIALLIGLFYAALCICTTFIFLDRRENTFCVPMHCGSSMLSGFTATYALTFFFNQNPPSAPQLTSAGLIIIALAFLSPLHHFERYLGKLISVLERGYQMFFPSEALLQRPKPVALSSLQTTISENVLVGQKESLAQDHFDTLRRIFLFVCSGNTCRSPMAAAIGNAEIAARLNIPFETLGQANVQAFSAGVSARVGASIWFPRRPPRRTVSIQTVTSKIPSAADWLHTSTARGVFAIWSSCDSMRSTCRLGCREL
jgi:hypothetical protein